jgi:pyruvate/2-oxoglutarate/acetoin dehydrogenase E1 component
MSRKRYTRAINEALVEEMTRDPNVILFGEDVELDYTIAFGKAVTARQGKDLTVVAVGSMLKPALEAAQKLDAAGLDVEVIDPRTLVPLDEDAIVASARKTGRVVIVDEARDTCSAASHIAAVLADKAFDALKAPIKRVTVRNVCMPYAANAEQHVLPSADTIERACLSIARRTA